MGLEIAPSNGAFFREKNIARARIGPRKHVLHGNAHKQNLTNTIVLFCSLSFLDPRVGHTMDVLSPFISVLCHSD